MPMWDSLINEIGQNDLLKGGFILGALTVVWGILRSKFSRFWYYLRHRFVVSILVTDDLEQYKWISYWISQQKYMKKARRLSFERLQKWSYDEDLGILEDTEIEFIDLGLAPGWHLIWLGWRPIIIERIRDKLEMAERNKSVRNEWQIEILGSRRFVDKLLQDMEKEYRAWKTDKKGVITWVPCEYGGFTEAGEIKERSLDSVILPESIKTTIHSDLQLFLESKNWYNKMNIPWRRGYLFAGPPGCGKTSLAKALASHFGLDLYVIPLEETDSKLVKLFNETESGIVLLEDIDCVYKSRRESEEKLSNLLNAIDGALSTDGRVLIMTTNYPDQLDTALIRPGRIDLKVLFTQPRKEEIKILYERFFPDLKGDVFATTVYPYKPSMAELQGYLLKYRHDGHAAEINGQEIIKQREEEEEYNKECRNLN